MVLFILSLMALGTLMSGFYLIKIAQSGYYAIGSWKNNMRNGNGAYGSAYGINMNYIIILIGLLAIFKNFIKLNIILTILKYIFYAFILFIMTVLLFIIFKK